jgi:hypothetical protein
VAVVPLRPTDSSAIITLARNSRRAILVARARKGLPSLAMEGSTMQVAGRNIDQSAFGRAMRDEWDFLGNAWGAMIAIAVGLAIAFLALIYPGYGSDHQQFVIFAAGEVAYIFVSLAFFWQRAPFRQRDEARKQLVNEDSTYRDEAAYYKRIIEVQTDQKERQGMHAALIDEGVCFVDVILTSGDDQLPRLRTEVENWRQRSREFLETHSMQGATDAAQFYRAFNRPESHFIHKGSGYSGDRAMLASQVDNATASLQGMYIGEKNYLDYRTASSQADLYDGAKGRA